MVREIVRKRIDAMRGDTPMPLTATQEELIREEIDLLKRLISAIERFPITAEDRAEIADAADRLTSLFLLVIVGEFNAGKSAFINALIGAPVMPEGVTPTTAVINLLRYGDVPRETTQPDGIIERFFPARFLADITVVDTPGTNAIIREHEQLTRRFVPRADIVLFVTSADRPFTESERAFLETIREWGKKVVLIVNKVDLIRTQEDVDKIVAFVQENITRLLGFKPDIFPVSAMLAQQAKDLGQRNPEESARLWEQSRFGALEQFVFSTLDEAGRIRLKLLSPLGVGEQIAERYLKATNDRLHVLKDDTATIERIEHQLDLYQEDMRQQFDFHRTRIENIIGKMNARGDEYFDETIRLGRVFDLLKSEKIKLDFQDKVVGDTEKQIDQTVDDLIDWMVEQDLRTWQAITDHVDRRRLSTYEDEMIGEISGQFRYDRRALLEAVSKRAQEEVDRYDVKMEAHKLSTSVKTAVAQVAVTEAGAVGLGALVVAAASTAAVDVTGIIAASLVAGLGLFILPRKRKQSRQEFRRRSDELETRLVDVMNEQFDVELERSVMRIRDAIAPYTRFVRAELEKLESIETQTTEVLSHIRTLRHKIGGEDRVSAGVTVRRPIDAPLPTQAISPRSSATPPPPVIEMPAPAEPVVQTPSEVVTEPASDPEPKVAPTPAKPEAISADDV
ncbi:MAG: dynamin family protein [Thermomicrobiales bacterium]|nr:dynamin family protein [Thermomicrobiales bacterium]